MSANQVTPDYPATRSTSLTSFVKNHPLLTFFIIAYVGSWTASLPFLAAQYGLLSFTAPEWVVGGVFAYAGPFLAAVLATLAIEGRPGLTKLAQAFLRWRVGVQWYVIALAGPPILLILSEYAVVGSMFMTTLVQNWALIFTFLLPRIVALFFISILAEETGWRGFALPRLQARFSPLRASLILGVLWGLWHFPIILSATPADPGTAIFSTLVVSVLAIFVTILLNWVYNGTRSSLFIATLLHATIDASQMFVLMLVTASKAPVAPVQASLAIYAAYAVAALAVIVLTRGRLSSQASEQTVALSS